MSRKSVIGLDIGTSAVRAAEVDVKKTPPVLERFGQVMLPVGAVRDGIIVDDAAVGDTITELWKRGGFRSKNVLIGVSNQHVIVRQVEMPKLEDSELRQGLAYQVQDQIPIPVEDAILDFQTIEEYEGTDGAQMMRVLLVAAQRDMVSKVIAAIDRAGLKPETIDLVPFALMRTLGDLGTGPSESGDGETAFGVAEAIVDVGAGITNIVVHESGVPRFVRILVGGGHEITEALASANGSSIEEAELAKRQVALGGGDAESGTLIDDRMQQVVEEVRGSLEFFDNQTDGAHLSRVIVTGGGAQDPNFVDELARATGIPTAMGHPLSRVRLGKIGLSPEQLAEAEPLISVPVGLALGDSK